MTALVLPPAGWPSPEVVEALTATAVVREWRFSTRSPWEPWDPQPQKLGMKPDLLWAHYDANTPERIRERLVLPDHPSVLAAKAQTVQEVQDWGDGWRPLDFAGEFEVYADEYRRTRTVPVGWPGGEWLAIPSEQWRAVATERWRGAGLSAGDVLTPWLDSRPADDPTWTAERRSVVPVVLRVEALPVVKMIGPWTETFPCLEALGDIVTLCELIESGAAQTFVTEPWADGLVPGDLVFRVLETVVLDSPIVEASWCRDDDCYSLRPHVHPLVIGSEFTAVDVEWEAP